MMNKDKIQEESSYEKILQAAQDLPMEPGYKAVAHILSEAHQQNLRQWWTGCYLKPIAGVFESGMEMGELKDPEQFGSSAERCARMLLNLLASHPAR